MPSSTSAWDREERERPDMVGFVGVLLATAFWGTSGIFLKLILVSPQVSVLSLAFWRNVATFLVMFAGLRVLRPSSAKVTRGDLMWLAGLGASVGVLHIFWNVAVLLNGAAVATVQLAATPALVAVAARLLWRERLTLPKILAIALTFVGTVLVSGLNVLGDTHLSILGFSAGLGLPLAYAGWNLLIKRLGGTHNLFTVLTYGFGFAALVLLPVQFFVEQPRGAAPSTLLYFAGLVILGTIGGFSIYAFALGRLQASVASILAMAEIPIVAVYAYVLLGERMTTDQVLGAVLVTIGALTLSLPRTKRA